MMELEQHAGLWLVPVVLALLALVVAWVLVPLAVWRIRAEPIETIQLLRELARSRQAPLMHVPGAPELSGLVAER